jgi:5'-methylthioadenosine phosphorylase
VLHDQRTREHGVADIGIIGGSGFYELLDDATEHVVDTPFGPPSDALVTGSFAGREVAFLPRHGRDHTLPPHRVPYRANVWALRELGVQRVVAPCAVGSLRPDLGTGTFVVLDQFVDRTRSREQTFFDGPDVQHVAMADPYCPELRELTNGVLEAEGHPHETDGTIVVIEGPRFSTRAESLWYARQGWDVIGMTQVPEIPLLREAELCAVGIAMVTDHDAGVEGAPEVAAVTHDAVLEVMAANVDRLQAVLASLVAAVPKERGCGCGTALHGGH